MSDEAGRPGSPGAAGIGRRSAPGLELVQVRGHALSGQRRLFSYLFLAGVLEQVHASIA